MTWGALGTNSQASVEILEGLMADSKVPVAAHLTCVGHTESSIRQVIADLQAMGVNRFVALRGDRPKELSGAQPDTQLGALSDTQLNTQSKAHTDPSHLQHASDLVAILAEDPSRDISVAAYPEAHPESDGLEQDIHWLKHKLDKGAKRAITQFFFSADTFLRFRDKAQAAGITQTLVPGILPIHDIAKVQDFSAKCGAHVPQELVERFSKAGESGSKSAQACAVEQCVQLIQSLHSEGVKDFHLYTLNQPALSYQVGIELSGSRGARGSGGSNSASRSAYAAA